MKWQGYLNTNMGWQLVIETFPNQFNRNDVISALESRYGCKVVQVNPAPIC